MGIKHPIKLELLNRYFLAISVTKTLDYNKSYNLRLDSK